MHESTIIQRALLTVSDKAGILELAEGLHMNGVELVSTGNTAALLKNHGLPVTTVTEYTGFPEIMDGRVKTLHPRIYGGVLARRDIDADTMLAHDIPDIDLVVVNLYPFKEVSKNDSASLEEIIENIDIGGPTLIRAAAKNYAWCTVLVDPQDYPSFLNELKQNKGAVREGLRFQYALKAFEHTAAYDDMIANFFGQKQQHQPRDGFGTTFNAQYHLKEVLRYGENPNSTAAFFTVKNPPQNTIAGCTQHQGKALSYNNIADANTALECVKQLSTPACVIVKHANPCGAAESATLLSAYQKAYQCDSTSAFGGIIALNGEVDEQLMTTILEQQFVEVMIASQFSQNALSLAQKKENLRLLTYTPSVANTLLEQEIHSVNGGLLVQNIEVSENTHDFTVVTKRQPTEQEKQDLIFAWKIVKWVKSNAIVFAKDGQTLGIGAGQMSRIFSTEIAALKAEAAQLKLDHSVMASDAFFPFGDNIEKAHALGIRAIIQPGGSKRDDEVIALANQYNIAMIFTHSRCFRH